MDNRRIIKRCPKCRGALFHVDDIHGEYEQCLQCGFIKYPTIVRLTKAEEEELSKAVVTSSTQTA